MNPNGSQTIGAMKTCFIKEGSHPITFILGILSRGAES